MASDSQSTCKNKDCENIKSKGRILHGSSSTTMGSEALDTHGPRRLARESSLKKQLPPSPASARKSEQLEKQTPTNLPVKRKSMIVEKHMPNALRRSERGTKRSTSSSSGSKKYEKSSASSDANEPKEKKEKTVKQLTLETGEVKESEKQNTKPVRMTKSKIISSRAYTAFLRRNASNLVNATEALGDKTGAAMSTQSPNLIHAKKVLEVEDGDSLQILKRGDSFHVDCTVSKKMGSPELVESTLIGRTGDAKTNLVASHTLSSLKRKRDMDMEPEGKRTETCGTCLKRQRPDSVSTKQVLCSCKKILDHSEDAIDKRMDRKGSPLTKFEVASEGAARKHKNMVSSSTELPTLNSGRDEGIVAAGSKEAFHASLPSEGGFRNPVNDTQQCLLPTSHIEYDGGRKVCDAQKSLYLCWKPEMSRLCETLQLSEDIKDMVDKVFEYVMNNHCVSREPPQAFQISLCWIAASLLKKKIDKKHSLALAKQHLNFCCDKEEATYVYLKLRCLKYMFLHHRGYLEIANSPRASSVSTKDDPFGSPNASNHQREDIVDQSLNIKNLVERDISISMERLQKKCKKQLKKLIKKGSDELRELHSVYEKEKAELEKKHRTELAVIRCLDRSSKIKDRIQMVENAFARKVEQQKQQLNTRLQDLRKMQRSAQKKVGQKFTLLKYEVKCWSQVELLDRLLLEESGCLLEYPQTSEQGRVQDGNENVSLEKQSPYRNASGLPIDMVKPIEIPEDSSVVGSGVQIEAVIQPDWSSHSLYGDAEKVHSMTPLSPEEQTTDAARLSIFDGEVIHGVLGNGDTLEAVHINKEINGVIGLPSNRPNATGIDQRNGEGSTINQDSHLQELCPGNAPVVQSECFLPQGGISHLNQGLQDQCFLPSISTEMQGGEPSSKERHDTEQGEALQSHPNDDVPSDCNREAPTIEPGIQSQLSPTGISPYENPLDLSSAGEIRQPPSTAEPSGSTTVVVQSDGDQEASVAEILHGQVLQDHCSPHSMSTEKQDGGAPSSEGSHDNEDVKAPQDHCSLPSISAEMQGGDAPSSEESHDTEEVEAPQDHCSLPSISAEIQGGKAPSSEESHDTEEGEAPMDCSNEIQGASEPIVQPQLPPADSAGEIGHLPCTREQYGTHNDVQSDGNCEASVMEPVLHLLPRDNSSGHIPPELPSSSETEYQTRMDHDLPSDVQIEYQPSNEGQNVTAEVEPPPQSQPVDALPSELRIQEAPVRDPVVQLQISAPIDCSSDHNPLDLPSSKETEYQTRTNDNVPSGVQIECQPSNEGQSVTAEVEPPPQSQPIDALPSELRIHKAPVREPPVLQLQISAPMDCSSDHNPPDLPSSSETEYQTRTDHNVPSGVQIDYQPSNEGQNVAAEVEPPPQSQPIDALPSEHRIHEAPVREPVVQLQISAPMDCSSDHNPLLTSRSLGMQTAHVMSRMSVPFSLDPLQNELDRLRKVIDHSVKIHEDMKLQLQADCEKEIEEAIAEIRKKYETKLQETEVEFSREKKEMEASHNKILMNKILAEAFRYNICVDGRASGMRRMQQDTVSSSRRQQQVQLQQTGQRLPFVSGSPVTPTQHPPGRPHSSILPPQQPVHHSRPLASSPIISHFTGPHPASSRQGGSEIRAPAPHLQYSRPRSPLPCGMPSQQQPPSAGMSSSALLSPTSLLPLPRAMPIHQPPHTAIYPSSSSSLPALPRKMPGQQAPRSHTSNPSLAALPALGLNLDQVALSGLLGSHGRNVGTKAHAASADSIVCLSDND